MFWARFVTDGEPPVRSHWPGLSDVEAIDAIETKQWLNLAINNNNREEVAVYLRLGYWYSFNLLSYLGASPLPLTSKRD